MKKLKGFTLIELIVVIAIIGILAAILVPSVMGWVHKSQVATYNNNASELCTQLQTTLTDLETTGRGYLLDSCTITYDKGTVTCSAAINSDVENEIKNISSRLADISESKWIAEIDHSTIQAIIFTNNDYKQVGGFPHECTPEFRTTGRTTAQMLECAKKGWS